MAYARSFRPVLISVTRAPDVSLNHLFPAAVSERLFHRRRFSFLFTFGFLAFVYRWMLSRLAGPLHSIRVGYYRETARVFFSTAPSTQLRCAVPHGHMRNYVRTDVEPFSSVLEIIVRPTTTVCKRSYHHGTYNVYRNGPERVSSFGWSERAND